MAPQEYTQVWEYSRGMTINIMILVFWSIILLFLTTNKRSVLMCVLHTVISNLILMYFKQCFVCSHKITYSNACINQPNSFTPFYLTKSSDLNYGCICLYSFTYLYLMWTYLVCDVVVMLLVINMAPALSTLTMTTKIHFLNSFR